MSAKSKLVKIAVPLIVIIAGVAIMQLLITSRPAPNREIKQDPGVLVQIMKAQKQSTHIMVQGTGTVEAAQEISIIPQVSGRITYVAPNLKVGGVFKKGETLFEIEDTDYRLNLERARSAKAKADYDLATIESQAKVARTEWEKINEGSATPPNPLVVYEPQLKSSRAALASAEAQVEQAQVDLARTKITAPFNARIRSENIDPGQYVRSGTSAATLAGTDTAEIGVPLSLDDIGWLNIPSHGRRLNGADAVVRLRLSGKVHDWQGRVVRSTGEVDPRSRMMQLIVAVDDPYGLKGNRSASQPALASGAFVDVLIRGRKVDHVFIIPRTIYRENESVWIMDSDSRLRIQKVVPLRIKGDDVIISEGLNEGDLIIVTNISGAADGMKLRRLEQ